MNKEFQRREKREAPAQANRNHEIPFIFVDVFYGECSEHGSTVSWVSGLPICFITSRSTKAARIGNTK